MEPNKTDSMIKQLEKDLKELKEVRAEELRQAEELKEVRAEELRQAEEPKRWRAELDRGYYFLRSDGVITKAQEHGTNADHNLWICGNYFKSEEEAKASMIYMAFHYHIAMGVDVPKIKGSSYPNDLEVFNTLGEWRRSEYSNSIFLLSGVDQTSLYRWKKRP